MAQETESLHTMESEPDHDLAIDAFELIKQKHTELDMEDRIRFSHMITGLSTDYEKEIIRLFEKAHRYYSPEAFDDLRISVTSNMFRYGSRSMDMVSRKRKRNAYDNNKDDDEAGPSVSI